VSQQARNLAYRLEAFYNGYSNVRYEIVDRYQELLDNPNNDATFSFISQLNEQANKNSLMRDNNELSSLANDLYQFTIEKTLNQLSDVSRQINTSGRSDVIFETTPEIIRRHIENPERRQAYAQILQPYFRDENDMENPLVGNAISNLAAYGFDYSLSETLNKSFAEKDNLQAICDKAIAAFGGASSKTSQGIDIEQYHAEVTKDEKQGFFKAAISQRINGVKEKFATVKCDVENKFANIDITKLPSKLNALGMDSVDKLKETASSLTSSLKERFHIEKTDVTYPQGYDKNGINFSDIPNQSIYHNEVKGTYYLDPAQLGSDRLEDLINRARKNRDDPSSECKLPFGASSKTLARIVNADVQPDGNHNYDLSISIGRGNNFANQKRGNNEKGTLHISLFNKETGSYIESDIPLSKEESKAIMHRMECKDRGISPDIDMSKVQSVAEMLRQNNCALVETGQPNKFSLYDLSNNNKPLVEDISTNDYRSMMYAIQSSVSFNERMKNLANDYQSMQSGQGGYNKPMHQNVYKWSEIGNYDGEQYVQFREAHSDLFNQIDIMANMHNEIDELKKAAPLETVKEEVRNLTVKDKVVKNVTDFLERNNLSIGEQNGATYIMNNDTHSFRGVRDVSDMFYQMQQPESFHGFSVTPNKQEQSIVDNATRIDSMISLSDIVAEMNRREEPKIALAENVANFFKEYDSTYTGSADVILADLKANQVEDILEIAKSIEKKMDNLDYASQPRAAKLVEGLENLAMEKFEMQSEKPEMYPAWAENKAVIDNYKFEKENPEQAKNFNEMQ